MTDRREQLSVALMVRSQPTRLWIGVGLGAIAILVAITLYVSRAGFDARQLLVLGYPGIFLLMLISGGGVFLAGASQAAVVLGGAVWNPLLVGLFAALGNATGELTGYAAGRGGIALLSSLQNKGWYKGFTALFQRYGFLTIFAMSAVPNPVFDIAGLAAGSAGYPIRKFWLACLLGNYPKYTALAYFGISLLDRFG